MEWQPIETAPLDGRQVLFYAPAGCLIAPSTPALSAAETRKAHIAVFKETGEWPNVQYTPTHWMPLPQPPRLIESIKERNEDE